MPLPQCLRPYAAHPVSAFLWLLNIRTVVFFWPKTLLRFIKTLWGKIMRTLLLGISLLLFSVTQAATITFDAQSLGTISSPLIIGDFVFYASGAEIIEESTADNALYLQASGSTNCFCSFDGDAGPLEFSMTSTSGDPFAFYGADVSATSIFGIVYSGFDGLEYGGAYPLGPFALGPVGTGDWLNLQEVRFYVASYGVVGSFDTLSITVDNINAKVVPIPAAAWLFGSALAGLCWLRRKPAV